MDACELYECQNCHELIYRYRDEQQRWDNSCYRCNSTQLVYQGTRPATEE
jgi:hypothetical protein